MEISINLLWPIMKRPYLIQSKGKLRLFVPNAPMHLHNI